VISLATDVKATASRLPGTNGQRDTDWAESLTVVICAYTTRRWADLCHAVESVLAQDVPALEVILVIDHCDELYLRTCSRFGKDNRVTVRQNTEAPGLSGARNTGVAAAHGDVVAFLDDDAAAEPGWAQTLMRHYQDRSVAAVGGYAAPIWPDRRPAWMPKEFDWVVGCSYVGQPTQLAPVRNPIGCNMSIRRSVLGVVGGFSSDLGRIGSLPVGCEETELCIRIRENQPSSQILLDPEAVVRHRVSCDRTTLRYFVQRCHREGMSKAIVTELANTAKALGTERTYAFSVLPRAVLREGLSLRHDGLARTAVILLGLAVTTAGYLRAKASRWVRRRTS
jgi:GT2 family glycosyltransferase